MSKEEMQKQWDEIDYDIEMCTCCKCPIDNKCKYAYDIYNINGDCLAEK